MEKCYSIAYAQGTYIGEDGLPHTFYPDGEFIYAESDEEAIAEAQRLADMGINYGDIGHQPLELLSVDEYDEEIGDNVRTVWS